MHTSDVRLVRAVGELTASSCRNGNLVVLHQAHDIDKPPHRHRLGKDVLDARVAGGQLPLATRKSACARRLVGSHLKGDWILASRRGHAFGLVVRLSRLPVVPASGVVAATYLVNALSARRRPSLQRYRHNTMAPHPQF